MFESLALSTAITAGVSGIVAAVVSAVVAAIKTQGKRARERDEREKAEQKAMHAGMCALLWRELKTCHELAEDQNGLTIAQRRHLQDVYSAYHSLGGNGTGTRLYSDAMGKPVIC